jgi:hypothetical protein
VFTIRLSRMPARPNACLGSRDAPPGAPVQAFCRSWALVRCKLPRVFPAGAAPFGGSFAFAVGERGLVNGLAGRLFLPGGGSHQLD